MEAWSGSYGQNGQIFLLGSLGWNTSGILSLTCLESQRLLDNVNWVWLQPATSFCPNAQWVCVVLVGGSWKYATKCIMERADRQLRRWELRDEGLINAGSRIKSTNSMALWHRARRYYNQSRLGLHKVWYFGERHRLTGLQRIVNHLIALF